MDKMYKEIKKMSIQQDKMTSRELTGEREGRWQVAIFSYSLLFTCSLFQISISLHIDLVNLILFFTPCGFVSMYHVAYVS